MNNTNNPRVREFPAAKALLYADGLKKGDFEKTKIKGKITEPKRSKWTRGFNVSLPASLAVESPSL